MNAQIWGITMARSLGLLFSLQGNAPAAAAFFALADAATAGRNVDAHMQGIADGLVAGGEPDWDNVRARIAEDSAGLHA